MASDAVKEFDAYAESVHKTIADLRAQLAAAQEATKKQADRAVRAELERDEARDCGESHSEDACGACVACLRVGMDAALRSRGESQSALAAAEARAAKAEGEAKAFRNIVESALIAYDADCGVAVSAVEVYEGEWRTLGYLPTVARDALSSAPQAEVPCVKCEGEIARNERPAAHCSRCGTGLGREDVLCGDCRDDAAPQATAGAGEAEPAAKAQEPTVSVLAVNSVGTCMRCGYHGPGPAHPCRPAPQDAKEGGRHG